MDIYIKPCKKATLAGRSALYVRDICEVAAPPEALKTVKNLKLLDINTSGKASYLVSALDIVTAVTKARPKDTVVNLGEKDTLVEYSSEKSRDNPCLKWLKVAFVALVLAAGSATAIMSFHSDAQIPKVFEKYHEIIFGVKNDKPLIIDIPYSVGLAVGILLFFNHFMGRKITDDPTPIEVEMSLYETDINDTKIDALDTEKLRRKEGKSNVDV
ncbi:MAG: stage V sporulation protein AA [Clostridiales bacterium]|jgi:stage V sporulation protein AA|nr:stage V sporulation protein AA [Clostridiales bacterium]